jgi:hypothetical protein
MYNTLIRYILDTLKENPSVPVQELHMQLLYIFESHFAITMEFLVRNEEIQITNDVASLVTKE